MTLREILLAYRRGELSTGEVRRMLGTLNQSLVRSPLSVGQKGLWLLYKLNPGDSAYTIPLCFRVTHAIELEALREACARLVDQHPLLGSLVEEIDGEPYLSAQASTKPAFTTEDISELPQSDVLPYLKRTAKQAIRIDQELPFRVYLMSRSLNEHFLLILVHHIVFDGRSVPLLIKALFDAYEGVRRGEQRFRQFTTSYAEFVAWERAFLCSDEASEHRAYWIKQLTGPLPILTLPSEQARLHQQAAEGEVLSEGLLLSTSENLRSFALSHRINPSVVFLAVYKLLLYQYTGVNDVIVGMPTIGRPQSRFDEVIGYFINMIALRTCIDAAQSFAEMLRGMQLTMLDALDHAAYPFPTVVRDLNQLRGTQAPVFQLLFEYQNARMLEVPDKTPLLNGGVRLMSELCQTGGYKLALEVRELEDGFKINVKFDASILNRNAVAAMLKDYLRLLEAVLANPDVHLHTYERPSMPSGRSSNALSLHALIVEQAKRSPESIAVTYESAALSYGQLDTRSTALAQQLRVAGVTRETVVAVIMERSLELPLALLGILKAGGAYLPIDPATPQERVEFILRDAAVTAAVTQARFANKLSTFAGPRFQLEPDSFSDTVTNQTVEVDTDPSDLAYVIYTSGSTGTPKGCMISHAAICNRLIWMQQQYRLHDDDRVLQKTPFVFDVSVWEFFWPLLAGARVVMARPEGHRDSVYLAETIQQQGVTVCHFVPSMLRLFLKDPRASGCTSLRNVYVSGEVLSLDLLRAFKSQLRARLHNLYGPTEAAVDVTYWECEERPDGKVPIGRPIANTYIYVLDENLRSVPCGIEGELYIGGAGLGRGYLNRPELTERSFIKDPFNPGAKLYKTGDHARWLSDGNIEYLGRIDTQVKIRGHRIELEEIEACLASHPDIDSCMVVVCEQDNVKQLVACYVLDRSFRNGVQDVDSRVLRDYLSRSLPDYMLPVRFFRLDALPLTNNGKLNRKFCVDVPSFATTKIDATVVNQVEQQVLSIWRTVLNLQDIDLDEGFFDAGGDSILAATVAERIAERLDLGFSVTELFKHASIRNISRHILARQNTHSPLSASSVQLNEAVLGPACPEYMEHSIAIIGISCQFPGAEDHHEFWRNLRAGKESIVRLSQAEMQELDVPLQLRSNPRYVPARAVIDGRELFDAEFFKTSARDAQLMDPQSRLLLMHAWATFEDAGYRPSSVPETAVFMSASNNAYHALAASTDVSLLETPEQYVSWVLAQSGTIPTLISHRLGLTGPSTFMHSNCSSSLTILDAACRCLLQGQAKQALVGAATVLPRASRGYVHHEGMNLSSDGHVHAFDAAADGMVGGEGVAVILLKRAAEAVADGDYIYALIRGTALNNDGSSKAGYYAPSVTGQVQVIEKVLRDTQIDPQSIGYVEAHGTGTQLGDPIEFAALCEAYRKYTNRTQFCGLGSVKTNIGHLDVAAGLAGCIKAALSLANEEIPPTLNYSCPNLAIDLDTSPFYIADTLKRWEVDPRHPRRAAVSSFGIGGTNAHLILEEYRRSPTDVNAKSATPQLVPLSAMNSERLQDYAERLLRFSESLEESVLADLAYTFQVGREALSYRVAFVVNSLAHLRESLRLFVAGKRNMEGFFHADKQSTSILKIIEDDDTRNLVDKWKMEGKIAKIAMLWVAGVDVDWNALHSGQRPRRISLPTYPFAKVRYWIDECITAAPRPVTGGPKNQIHPLLHENISRLNEQCFHSTFTGKEFFLCDHVVSGIPVLPGAAHLEMARVAFERSTREVSHAFSHLSLLDVAWLRPVPVTSPSSINIALYSLKSDDVAFEIYAPAQNKLDNRKLYSQGRIRAQTAGSLRSLDLVSMRAAFQKPALLAADCYTAFSARGYEYGPAFQGIDQIFYELDADNQPVVLARVRMPEASDDTTHRFVLHPGFIDSVLQTLLGLEYASERAGGLTHERGLPFTLDALEIYGPCPSSAWVWVRASKGIDYNSQKVDIDVCDEAGIISLQFKGYSTRARRADLPATGPMDEEVDSTILVPVWEPVRDVVFTAVPVSSLLVLGGSAAQRTAIARDCPQAVTLEFLVEDTVDVLAERLKALAPFDHVLWMAPPGFTISAQDENLRLRQEQGVICCFRLIKALLKLGYVEKVLKLSFITEQAQLVRRGERIDPAHASVHGLAGSAAKEYPNWQVRVIDVEENEVCSFGQIMSVPPDPQGNVWAHRHSQWYRQVLIPAQLPPLAGEAGRRQGVYVVIGGAGGLGRVWSEHMIRSYDAQVVWIGRRPKDATIQQAIDHLSVIGRPPQYISADAADREQLAAACLRIKSQHGRIHGVVHSALVLADKSLRHMDEQLMRSGLRPKVDAALCVAQVFGNEPLDFLLFFSAMQSFAKSAGQSNYAAGCTFKDAFAQRLAQECTYPVKVMNWGYWGGVGVVASKPYQERMAQLGIGSIEPAEGLKALHSLHRGPFDQLALLKTIGNQAWAVLPVDAESTISLTAGSGLSACGGHVAMTSLDDAALSGLDVLLNVTPAEFDSSLLKLLFCQLQLLGLFVDEHCSLADWKKRAGILASYEPWLAESLNMLVRQGWLSFDDVYVQRRISVMPEAIWQEWRAWRNKLQNVSHRAQADLAEVMLKALPDIITGKRAATDVMFPDASLELAERIYKGNPFADFYNDALANAVAALIEDRRQHDPGVRIRILEIGAGTGGTSTAVFKRLKPLAQHIEEYCYTDISKSFLNYAEANYGAEHPYLRYRVFNVEQPLAAQGIEPGYYDLVIAANVLHATKRIHDTLHNTKANLKEGGWLLLNEMSRNPPFAHVTFGLLEGWWVATDTAVRIPGSPGLSPANWRTVLEDVGFEQIHFPVEQAHRYGHQLIVARSDGIVRQRRGAVLPPMQLAGQHLLSLTKSYSQAEPNNEAPDVETPTGVTTDQKRLRNFTLGLFKERIGRVLRVPGDTIDSSKPLETYGIDSILAVQLASALREILPGISSTLFFEFQTVDALVDHFLERRLEDLSKLLYGDVPEQRSFFVAENQHGSHKPKHRTVARSRERDIAIIGLSGNYPAAKTLAQYWDNLKAGRDCVTQIPPERWPLQDFFISDPVDAVAQCKSYSKWGAFVEDFCEFDPLFFKLSPREAIDMDPQERLFLRVCWEAFEDAGYTRELLAAQHRGQVGVFVGVSKTGFELYGPPAWRQGERFHPHTSFSSVANRVSYLMDLRGPSLPVDTMCSSSLSAIHEACEHLLRGECEMAIAGGVNLNLHPATYITLSEQRVLSRDGRCKSFAQGGDGIVPGEGAGAVVLKSLDRALADRDHIHAVIRGTAINHGGRTHGYTVPNPAAQADLVRKTMQRAGVNAREISYIEAHGTGTELGDPIEIVGLTNAFRKDTEDKQFCAIGSVKTQIGHLEAAAGIAGLTKVVLQMQHRTIAPTLHAELCNPNIVFEETPFVLVREAREWPQPQLTIEGQRMAYARLAGISSFGAGGSNAHVIVEEYADVEDVPIGLSQGPFAIVLSAKTAEQLQELSRRLLEAVQTRFTDTDLPRIAYTLQTGREALEYRLAFLARSTAELSEILQKILTKDSASDVWQGEADVHPDPHALLGSDASDIAVETWLRNADLSKLLSLWVKGLSLDWNRLYPGVKPRRISLPTYPFATERYWIPEASRIDLSDMHSIPLASNVRHPLLQQNTSNFESQRFSTVLDGSEFFLADHRVGGNRILPAVVYLEMARAAVSESLPRFPVGTQVAFRHVAWLQPFICDGTPKSLHIVLSRSRPNEVDFEAYSEPSLGERCVHARGQAAIEQQQPAPITLLEPLRSFAEHELDIARCYEWLSKGGFDYGAAQRALQSIHVGVDRDGAKFVLARLRLPAGLVQTQHHYVLHPSLLDGAWQAVVGLQSETSENRSVRAIAPFALEELRWFAPCPEEAWAVVRETTDSNASVRKVNIEICDRHGEVCVRCNGLSGRDAGSSLFTASETMLFTCAKAFVDLPEPLDLPQYGLRYVVWAENGWSSYPQDERIHAITRETPGTRCLILETAKGLAEEFTQYAVQLLAFVQTLMRGKLDKPVLIQLLVPAQDEAALQGALMAMLRCAHSEQPLIFPQLLVLDRDASPEEWVRQLHHGARVPWRSAIHCLDSMPSAPIFKEAGVSNEITRPWKIGGIYLFTGGMGELGFALALDAAEHTERLTLLLVGRSELNGLGRRRLETLQAQGAHAEYQRLDVADDNAVARYVATIEARFGKLDGIVHCAGLVRDRLLVNKNKAELESVFAAKVAGTCNLDQATRHLPLDFFVMFSSAATVLDPAGQSDYATANSFMDQFAYYRHELSLQGQRRGRSIAINWPLWADGGMKPSDQSLEQMHRRGLYPLATAAGTRAFYSALNLQSTQVLVLEGERDKILHVLAAAERPPAVRSLSTQAFTTATYSLEELREFACHYFGEALAAALKLPVNRIEPHASFDKYGIDSIIVMQLTGELERIFGVLPKTLFFEYQSIDAIAGYFVRHHLKTLAALWMHHEQLKFGEPPNVEREGTALVSSSKPSEADRAGSDSAEVGNARPLDIAIIGVAGTYPQANTLEDYWKNLQGGKDCVTEIPLDRWDHSVFFDAEKGKAGKTYCKWGGFIDGVDTFDPVFFGISPREAALLDPQERLFLMCAHEVIEDAGYTREALASPRGSGIDGNVGVFVGVMYEDYQLYGAQSQTLGRPLVLGGSPSSIANRVSYFGNFHGPSMAVDTMCSSSLSAIHLACQSLAQGECDLAIAGGVNITVHPNKYLGLGQGQFASSNGRCVSFGNGGDGYVPAEGVGAVLLKPLSQAIVDCDHIYGVIKGSAVNHGGRSNGYTVPNPAAQAQVVQQALKQAGIEARAISYVEAHGTGTALGDPIEIAGLTRAFRAYTDAAQFCAIGSVKSNIGHCESAAGIAGLTKVLLQLQHRQLVPSLHADELNPHIDFHGSPFVVQRELAEWLRPKLTKSGVLMEYPRVAGISSFGAGGANAHLVVQEYVEAESIVRGATQAQPVAIVLSAMHEERLREYARRLLSTLEAKHFVDADLQCIAYTLQIGREAMKHRIAMTARSIDELCRKLRLFSGEEGGDSEKIDECFMGIATGRHPLSIPNESNVPRNPGDDLTKQLSLLEAWVRGAAIDWREWHGEVRPRRVRLPTYPFRRKRYWAPDVLDGSWMRSPISELAAAQLSTKGESSDEEPRWPNKIKLATLEAAPIPMSEVDMMVQHEAVASSVTDRVALPVRVQYASFDSIVETLKSTLARALYLEPSEIDLNRTFGEMGLDSVIGVEWIREVNKSLGLTIATSKIYGYPTLRDFSEFVQSQFNDEAASDEKIDAMLQKLYMGEIEVAEAANRLRKSSMMQ